MIDAHHHFWKYAAEHYGWIDDGMAVLKRDYLPADLEAVAAHKGVTGVVAVQARESLAENDFLLMQARACDLVKGVVGWLPLASPEAGALLEKYADEPLFKGVREVMQGREDADFLTNDAFDAGIRLLTNRDLPYDVLIFERQLASAIRFVDRHPRQRFVLDHIAKPTILAARFSEEWARHVRELARREHVVCKISGVVTEVRDARWNAAMVRPYLDAVLEAFGAERLMFGSDWPVCLLRASYAEWIDTVRAWAEQLSVDEQRQIFTTTAAQAYRLGP